MIFVIGIILKFGYSRLVVISESYVGPFPPGLAEVCILYSLVSRNILNPLILLNELLSLGEQVLISSVKCFS